MVEKRAGPVKGTVSHENGGGDRRADRKAGTGYEGKDTPAGSQEAEDLGLGAGQSGDRGFYERKVAPRRGIAGQIRACYLPDTSSDQSTITKA